MSNDKKNETTSSVEVTLEDDERFKKFTKKVVKEILDDLETE